MIEDQETSAEKYARFVYWKEVYTELGGRDEPPSLRFFDTKHLIYNSHLGWDIRMLLAYGVKPGNIMALYSDADMARTVEEMLPEVRTVVGDPVSFCKRHHRKFGTAYLNLDTGLSSEFFETVFSVLAHGVKDGGILGVSFTTGGETGAIAGELDSQITEIRGFVERMRSGEPREVIAGWAHAMRDGAIIPIRESTYQKVNDLMHMNIGNCDYEKLEKEVAEDIAADMERITSAESAISRSDYFNYFVVSEGTRRRNGLAPRRVFYHESPELTKCISMGIVHRAFTGEGVQKYRRRFAGYVSSAHMKAPVNCFITDEIFMEKVTKAIRHEELLGTPKSRSDVLVPAFFSISDKQMSGWVQQLKEAENNDGSDE